MKTIIGILLALTLNLNTTFAQQRDTTFSFTVKVPLDTLRVPYAVHDTVHDTSYVDKPVFVSTPVILPPVLSLGYPFGFFNVDPTQATSNTSAVMFGGYAPSLITLLDSAVVHNRKVVLTLTGGAHKSYRSCNCSDSTFSFDLWKAKFDQFKNLNLNKYFDNGTIIALSLLDESQWAPVWFGKKVSLDLIDSMAGYAKARYPTAVITSRDDAMEMGVKKNWVYYDAAWEQYSMKEGDVLVQLANNVAAAKAAKLGLLFGINAADGGTVINGCYPAASSNKCAFSKSDLLVTFPKIFSEQYVCASMMWVPDVVYHNNYTSKIDIKAALDSVNFLATNRVRTPCKVR